MTVEDATAPEWPAAKTLRAAIVRVEDFASDYGPCQWRDELDLVCAAARRILEHMQDRPSAAPAPVEVVDMDERKEIAALEHDVTRLYAALQAEVAHSTRLAAEKAEAERVIEERGHAFQAAMNEALARAEAAERALVAVEYRQVGWVTSSGVPYLTGGDDWCAGQTLFAIARAPKDA